MKTLKGWIGALAALFLCGCFQVQDDLTLQADGSGTVKLTLHSNLPEELVGMLGMSPYGSGTAPMYPPANEAEARHFFPGKAFVLKVEQKDAAEGKSLVVEAAFKDINALLASPYGRAHQLALTTNQNGTLRLRALSGGETLAQAAVTLNHELNNAGAIIKLQLQLMQRFMSSSGSCRPAVHVVQPTQRHASKGAADVDSSIRRESAAAGDHSGSAGAQAIRQADRDGDRL